MRFLQLTKKFPFPPKDGESLLVSNFNRILKDKVDRLDLLSFNTIKHYFDVSTLPEEQNHYDAIYEVYLDNRIKWYEAVANVLSKTPYHISRFISKDFENKLEYILKNNQYDYILIESIFLASYIPVIRKMSNAKIILRAHNIEHEIWERIANNTNNNIKKAYISYLTGQLKKYEIKHIEDADVIITLTSRDLKKLKENGIKTRIFVVPAGINSKAINSKNIIVKPPLHISFLGSLDWMPNIEGLNWFVEHVLSKLSHTDIRLHVAGRNTPKTLYKLQSDNIKIHGEVPDSEKFLAQYPVMIVPLLSGGGMRLKILEAMALGRVIISTSIGLEGIDAIDGKHVLIADTEKEFVEKIQYCIENKDKLVQLSENAKQLFAEKYETSKIVQDFLNVLM